MNVLGNYSINIATNQTYVSKALLPFFCSNIITTPCLDAYFQNIIASERQEVESKFFSAILNLSDFDVVHFIKSNYKMMKIKNLGKAFLQSNSKVKKIYGTIISLDQKKPMVLNADIENETGEIFELERLLNYFIKAQKQKAAKANINLFLKMDVNLPKYTVGYTGYITKQLQTAFDEIVNNKTEIKELTLAVKLTKEDKTGFTVNFALEYNSKQATFYSFDTELKVTEDNFELNEKDDLVNQNPNSELKILLAEDHKMNQVIATSLLKKEFKGVEIDIVENGLAAFEILKNNNYALVLMDIDMPILNGIEATKKIRTELKTDIPIIAFSAHVFQDQIQKCFNAGMNDFIPKPVNVETLRQKIKNALNYSISNKGNKTILKNLYNSLDNNKGIAI